MFYSEQRIKFFSLPFKFFYTVCIVFCLPEGLVLIKTLSSWAPSRLHWVSHFTNSHRYLFIIKCSAGILHTNDNEHFFRHSWYKDDKQNRFIRWEHFPTFPVTNWVEAPSIRSHRGTYSKWFFQTSSQWESQKNRGSSETAVCFYFFRQNLVFTFYHPAFEISRLCRTTWVLHL